MILILDKYYIYDTFISRLALLFIIIYKYIICNIIFVDNNNHLKKLNMLFKNIVSTSLRAGKFLIVQIIVPLIKGIFDLLKYLLSGLVSLAGSHPKSFAWITLGTAFVLGIMFVPPFAELAVQVIVVLLVGLGLKKRFSSPKKKKKKR